MNLFIKINNTINVLLKKIFKIIDIQEKIKPNYPYSDKLQKKLALLIKDIEVVDIKDLKGIEHKKIEKDLGKDLFTSYRLDFHSRDELEHFKKKYNSLIL